MAGNKDVKRGIVIYIDGKEVKNNAKSIEAEMRKVKKEIENCTIGSEEYVNATKRYKELNSILKEHRDKLRDIKDENKSTMQSTNDWWNKWQLAIGAAVASLTAVGLALFKFRSQTQEKESAQANLKALTGLDDENIAWLTQQAEQLSQTMDETGLRVTQSSKEILDAYNLVGSAKPELLGNKEALNAVTVEAMRLAQAAKMDLKDAVNGVTLAMNQYGASADEASRYVNVLAAGSKFGAAGVEAQTQSIIKAGVAANVAKVPIESLVGSIETLGEKGIKGEIAGTGLKTFFLKLEGMADDVRPSVVGLQTALENLRAKNLSTAETQKMFGLEAYTVAQAMISGADSVKKYTESVTGTNTAIEQAAINSDTAEAELAQMKNQFNEQGMILDNELTPAITKIISLGMNSTKVLVKIIEFLTKHKVTLGLLTSAIGLYVTWVNRKIILDKLQVVWNNAVVTSYKKVIAVMASNPWGVALIAITAVTGALIEYNNSINESQKKAHALDDVNKKASEEYETQADKINRLNKLMRDNNANINARQNALNELKSIVPGYLGQLTKEGNLINDNNDAIKDYLKNLEKQIKLKAAQDELEELYKKKRQTEKDIKTEQGNLEQAHKNQAQANNNPLQTMGNVFFNIGQNAGAENRLNKLNKSLEKTKKNIIDVENEISNSNYVADIVSPEDGNGEDGSSSATSTSKDTGESAEQKRIKKETEAIETEIKKREAILKGEYASGKKTREQYNSDMEDLEIERITKILKIAGLEPEKIEELQNKLKDIAVKAREELESMELDTTPDDDYWQQYLDENQKIQEKRAEEIAILDKNLKLRNITVDDYNQGLVDINKQFEIDDAEAWEKFNENYRKTSDEVETNIDDRNAEVLEKIEKFKEKLDKLGIDLQQIAEDIGTGIGEAMYDSLKEDESLLKGVLKSILGVIIDAVDKMATAWMANVTIRNIGKLGLVGGLIVSSLETAAIKAALSLAKSALNGWSEGGYTGQGGVYEPAGTVHKGEFVANHFAVQNPAVKSVLDVIDSAQKNGTISNLTSDDIASIRPGYASGGYTSNNSSNTIVQENIELNQLVKDCTSAMKQVTDRFKQPIVAETYATGKHGTMEAEELVNRMKRNSQRR